MIDLSEKKRQKYIKKQNKDKTKQPPPSTYTCFLPCTYFILSLFDTLILFEYNHVIGTEPVVTHWGGGVRAYEEVKPLEF